MAEPPGLQLADEIGWMKLKWVSNKFMAYCLWISIWLQNGFPWKLLDSGSYNVNEVGLKIGYSTGSHFISHSKEICYHAKNT
jgi:hypothetical protein